MEIGNNRNTRTRRDSFFTCLPSFHLSVFHLCFKYENFIVLGYFNVGMDNSYMTVFCDTYDKKNKNIKMKQKEVWQ